MGKVETVLREEIARLARKEVRNAVSPLKKEVTRLKKRVAELAAKLSDSEKQTGLLVRERRRKKLGSDVGEEQVEATRISGGLIKKLRKKLGISQAQLAALVGVSSPAVAAWEQGRSRPAGDNLKAVVALRGYGRREIRTLLDQLDG
jgi:DNA-binding transcriptional regulator YiaG